MILRDEPEVLERFHAHLDLVEVIARQVHRVIGNFVELDDLRSAGREGLLDAARRYESARGVPFRGYANRRVRGAVLDAVRQMNVLSRRAYVAALEAAQEVSEGYAESLESAPQSDGQKEERIEDQLGTAAIACALRMLREHARAEATSGESLHDNPEQALARAETLALIHRELETHKPELRRKVLRLHYIDGLSIEAIAEKLAIDRSWASKLHTRGLNYLKKRLRRLVG